MSVYTEEDVISMDEKEQQFNCEWCWYHDYGDCNKCAIYKNRKCSQEQVIKKLNQMVM